MITFASVTCSMLLLLLLLAFVTPTVDAGRIRGRHQRRNDRQHKQHDEVAEDQDHHRREKEGKERLFDVGLHGKKGKKDSWGFGNGHGKKGNNFGFGEGKKGSGPFNFELASGPHHKGAGCFHGSARVEMENGMTEAMKEVQVGDRIMSVEDNGQRNVVDVVYVPHLQNEVEETFMKVSCRIISSERQGMTEGTEDEDNKLGEDYELEEDDKFEEADELEDEDDDMTTTLLITPGHFVFASTSIDTRFEDTFPITAEELIHAETDNTPFWLWILAGDDRVEPCEVMSLETVEETGIYSLFTSNGRMIVDGL
eukprot:CAMPEP_0194030296 /NCGR_PEP_ID=MMETSP0009_2-20130614/3845_1 /TAXON_ID=210454 /ORGANISM="Grammatophora oceanica, Strain CCMP 410" /LENGTH=310 /DNA_ID=CAMNT_0038670227 /DNA_START=59 /DNA_END=988 /DNA_ORIENTATION=+